MPPARKGVRQRRAACRSRAHRGIPLPCRPAHPRLRGRSARCVPGRTELAWRILRHRPEHPRLRGRSVRRVPGRTELARRGPPKPDFHQVRQEAPICGSLYGTAIGAETAPGSAGGRECPARARDRRRPEKRARRFPVWFALFFIFPLFLSSPADLPISGLPQETICSRLSRMTTWWKSPRRRA